MHVKVPTRDIKPTVQMMLWGKAGGRCEFNGCNQQLWKSPITQELVNIAQKAHIHAFSPGGPRGDRGIPKSKLNSIDNLILVCHACHRTIDQDKIGMKYSAKLLQQWKREHEQRIEIQTGVHSDRKSHVLLYGAKIGDAESPLSFNVAATAMFPDRYPADDKPIMLPPMKSWPCDRDDEFWRVEEPHLVNMYEQRVRQLIQDGLIRHLSLFAMAPQPLLIRLGSLLTDITEVQVYPRAREPEPAWGWRSHPRGFEFKLKKPKRKAGPVALVLALSDYVDDERITAALGKKATIWRVTIDRQHNDFLRSKRQLHEFRTVARDVLAQIGRMHGQETLLNVFPVAPAATAVELGRVRQPKANMPWQVWDQVRPGQTFVRALTIH